MSFTMDTLDFEIQDQAQKNQGTDDYLEGIFAFLDSKIKALLQSVEVLEENFDTISKE